MKKLQILAPVVVAVAATTLTGPAQAATSTDADDAMSAFIDAFWDPDAKYFYTNSDQQIHAEHAHGPENGLYTDFWWEAQLWETVMDAYERTSSATYRDMIDDVYDGFVAYYPTFANNFNDDQGWWALACVRAFEITSDSRYLDCAEDLFAIIWAEHDSTYGAGIWWRKSPHDQKNVATNATAAMTAARLYQATSDSDYLDAAEDLFDWVDTALHADGHVYDHIEGAGSGTLVKWDFTYNFGVYIGAAVSLYEATSTASYLDKAIDAADWATTYLTAAGTFLYEGVNDAGGFRTILIRQLMRLVDDHGQSQYLPLLQANVTQAWHHRRSTDDLVGANWAAPTGAGYLQSMTAAAIVSALQVVDPNGYSGPQPGTGHLDAENARPTGIGAESTNAGFLGRGYLAGWNSDGQSVAFDVVAASAGEHELTLRYAAAAGPASRRVLVNGSAVQANLTFPGTGSWSSWSEVVLNGVTLNQGYNTVVVEFDSASGSSNYLNLDRLTVSRQLEAESGALHGVGTESSHAGYTGTGYLAGWNSNGQWVDLSVSVDRAGDYDLTLRYAAGAGDASRYLYVNGAGVIDDLEFTSTGSWGTWSTVVIPDVPLQQGTNTISVIFDGSKGSANYLNLDHATLRYVG